MDYLIWSACKRSKPAAESSDAAGTLGAILADRNASGQANQTGIFAEQAYSDGTGIFNIQPLSCVQTAKFCEF